MSFSNWMRKKQKSSKPRVLFNASVVLSGLKFPHGGSGFLLKYAEVAKIEGIISEVIFDEILRHSEKLGLEKSPVQQKVARVFKEVLLAPKELQVDKYSKIVMDIGDAHVLASATGSKSKYLVTLDKKHLLVLKGKIRGLTILTPGELIAKLRHNVRSFQTRNS